MYGHRVSPGVGRSAHRAGRGVEDRAVSSRGARAWVGRTRETGQVILDRLTRPPRHRFERVGFLHYGYRVDEVDLIADKLARYLESGDAVTVEQVRSIAAFLAGDVAASRRVELMLPETGVCSTDRAPIGAPTGVPTGAAGCCTPAAPQNDCCGPKAGRFHAAAEPAG